MKALILTEGGIGIGMGHITRCVALYDGLKEAGVDAQLIVRGDVSVADLLHNKRHRRLNWLKDKGFLSQITDNDIVFVDSYLAGADFYRWVSQAVRNRVFLDDNKRIGYPGGFIVNGAPFAQELKYPKRENTVYLLGSRYALLRKEFWRVPQKRINKRIRSIMVSAGGANTRGTRRVISRLLDFLDSEYPKVSKNVISGGSLTADGLKGIMLKSDIAISAGGQTLNELARVGVPTIAIKTADNQANNIAGWQRAGFVYYAGDWGAAGTLDNVKALIEKLKGPAERQNKYRAARKFIDGKGSRRVVNRILRQHIMR